MIDGAIVPADVGRLAEPPLARELPQLLDERRRPPRCSRLRCHERQPSAESVTCLSQLRDRSRTEPGHLGVEEREERLGVVLAQASGQLGYFGKQGFGLINRPENVGG